MTLRREAHSLKGSSGYIAAEALKAAAILLQVTGPATPSSSPRYSRVPHPFPRGPLLQHAAEAQMEKPEVKAGPEALAEREKEESELMRIVSRVRREVRRVLDEIKGHVTIPHPSPLTPRIPATGATRPRRD